MSKQPQHPKEQKEFDASHATGVGMNGVYRQMIEGVSAFGYVPDVINWGLKKLGVPMDDRQIGGYDDIKERLTYIYEGYANNIAPGLNAQPENDAEEIVKTAGEFTGDLLTVLVPTKALQAANKGKQALSATQIATKEGTGTMGKLLSFGKKIKDLATGLFTKADDAVKAGAGIKAGAGEAVEQGARGQAVKGWLKDKAKIPFTKPVKGQVTTHLDEAGNIVKQADSITSKTTEGIVGRAFSGKRTFFTGAFAAEEAIGQSVYGYSLVEGGKDAAGLAVDVAKVIHDPSSLLPDIDLGSGGSGGLSGKFDQFAKAIDKMGGDYINEDMGFMLAGGAAIITTLALTKMMSGFGTVAGLATIATIGYVAYNAINNSQSFSSFMNRQNGVPDIKFTPEVPAGASVPSVGG